MGPESVTDKKRKSFGGSIRTAGKVKNHPISIAMSTPMKAIFIIIVDIGAGASIPHPIFRKTGHLLARGFLAAAVAGNSCHAARILDAVGPGGV